eukprot:scaffold24545_cov153-Skeletonema_marinoi.AAC.1
MPFNTVNIVNHIGRVTGMRPPLKVVFHQAILIFALVEQIFHLTIIPPDKSECGHFGMGQVSCIPMCGKVSIGNLLTGGAPPIPPGTVV